MSVIQGTGGGCRGLGRGKVNPVEAKYGSVRVMDIICPSCGLNIELSRGSIAAHGELGSERTICSMSGQPYKPKQEDTEDAILRKMFGE